MCIFYAIDRSEFRMRLSCYKNSRSSQQAQARSTVDVFWHVKAETNYRKFLKIFRYVKHLLISEKLNCVPSGKKYWSWGTNEKVWKWVKELDKVWPMLGCIRSFIDSLLSGEYFHWLSLTCLLKFFRNWEIESRIHIGHILIFFAVTDLVSGTLRFIHDLSPIGGWLETFA